MARPKKETVDYFPHFVNSGKTLFILEQNYGNDGYAFWFKILELLGSSDGHYYDCRNVPAWKFLLAKTNLSEEKTIEIFNMLVELEAIDKELWQEKIIWSDNFVKNLLPVYSNRKSELPKKPIITSSNDSTDEFLPVETEQNSISTETNSQSKVKESKVKESIDNNDDNFQNEIEIILTQEEANYISILSKIEDYPLDRRKDLDYMKTMQERYPTLDVIAAATKFSDYILDKPFKKNANHRSQLNTSFGKYVEWGICKKKEKPIVNNKKIYEDENPFLNRR